MLGITCRIYFPLLILVMLAPACKQKSSNEYLSGKELALRHCTGCHNFVDPQMLPKNIWQQRVLPAMGLRLGMYPGTQLPDSLFEDGPTRQLVFNAGIYPSEEQIPRKDWEKIVQFFLESAPDSVALPDQKAEIRSGLPHFEYRRSQFSVKPPATSMVKILPESSAVVFGDGKKNVSQLVQLNANLEKEYNLFLRETPIDYRVTDTAVFLTSVGTRLYPSDLAGGVIERIYSSHKQAKPDRSEVLVDRLQRPVHVNHADLNGDGMEDLLVCEFGYLLGKLAWYQNLGDGNYQLHYLSKNPGAVITVVREVNGDHLPDILALMAQGDEGIYLYRNSPAGFLKGEKILGFSPLQGSTGMELVDWDFDGDEDIIYTAGDNADISPVLKGYHGIYVFQNDGQYRFRQVFFYPLNGAYKAVARDYDEDGDLDIAAISFFPDYRRSPRESFVYLQNDGQYNFTAYSFPQATDGRWMVMDVNDLDGDGDLDIALGSFVEFKPDGDTTGLYNRWLENGPSVVLLENTLR